MDRLLRDTAAGQTPPHVVQALKDLFPLDGTKPKMPFLARMIASLSFDNWDQPIMAGVRSIAVPPRQRLYRAGDIDIDVKVEPSMDGKRITLTGQVLSDGSDFFDNIVRLEHDGMVHYRTRTNVLGEFSFEVPNDTYDLSIEIHGERIAVLDVNAR